LSKPKSPSKISADRALVERGLAESRTKAQALIMAGLVFSGESRIEKSGQQLKPDTPLEVRGQDHPWVSRGGLKLARALEVFDLTPKDAICLDVGASTGGFTDVLLQHGAAKVYAVDVGRGQLAWKLQSDDRVVVMDKTNARHLTAEHIPDPINLIVCDASFIGLQTLLPAALALAANGAHLVALIKPQFEVDRDQVGKGGIIKDPALHAEVCTRIEMWLNAQLGWTVLGITESPVKGAEGNTEFLLAAHFLAS
jgi:23S rRNA (cytidine1920-2'-O)/16S rRNA (cytidine1409-2'-O)-methyltransferase